MKTEQQSTTAGNPQVMILAMMVIIPLLFGIWVTCSFPRLYGDSKKESGPTPIERAEQYKPLNMARSSASMMMDIVSQWNEFEERERLKYPNRGWPYNERNENRIILEMPNTNNNLELN